MALPSRFCQRRPVAVVRLGRFLSFSLSPQVPMTKPKVRAHYADLTQMTQIFTSEADRLRTTQQRLQEKVAALQAGDWLGAGATAFYQEMQTQVSPALNRLGTALETAARTTQNIHTIMQQAETEAARLFNAQGLPNSGGAAPLTTGPNPGASSEMAPAPTDVSVTPAPASEGKEKHKVTIDFLALLEEEHRLREVLADTTLSDTARAEAEAQLAAVMQQQLDLLAPYLEIPPSTDAVGQKELIDALPLPMRTNINKKASDGGQRFLSEVVLQIPAAELTATTYLALVNQFVSSKENPRYAPIDKQDKAGNWYEETYCDIFVMDVLFAAEIKLDGIGGDSGTGIGQINTSLRGDERFQAITGAGAGEAAQAAANQGLVVIAIQPNSHGAVVVPSSPDSVYNNTTGPQIAQAGATPATVSDNTFVNQRDGGFGAVDHEEYVTYYVYAPDGLPPELTAIMDEAATPPPLDATDTPNQNNGNNSGGHIGPIAEDALAQ